MARVLLNQAVGFRAVYGADIRALQPEQTPCLVLCDAVLPAEPDGSGNAVAALLGYVEQGGHVLYLSPSFFRVAYGSAVVPQRIREACANVPANEVRTVAWGKGRFTFSSCETLAPRQAATLLPSFLTAAGVRAAVERVQTTPVELRENVFVFTLSGAGKRLLGVLNKGETVIQSVEISVGTDAARTFVLAAADGATRARAEVRNTLQLRNLNTYAVFTAEE